MTVKLFALDKIDPNPFQVRLAEDAEQVAKVALSIAHSGLLQTPVGRQDGDRALLAFGHTRLAAFRKLAAECHADPKTERWDYDQMRVDVRDLTDQELFELAIRENIDRKDLTPIEEARAMATYHDVFGKTSVEIGELFGLSDSAVRNRMRLLELPRPVQEHVEGGGITEGTARKLLTVQKIAPKEIEDLAEKLVKGGYQTSDVIDDQLAGIMETSAHILCGHCGGQTSRAGHGLWKLDWKGGVKTPRPGPVIEILDDRGHAQSALKGDVLAQAIAAFASGTDVAGVIELFGLSEPAAAIVGQLVAPPPCSSCEFHQVLNGVHYCGLKACWDQKKLAWIAAETQRVAKKLGIAVYDAAADGKAKVKAPAPWGDGGRKLDPSWVKLLDAKDASLRVIGRAPNYEEFPGTGSEVVELVRVGKPAEKAKADRKRSSSGSGIYNAAYYERQGRREQLEHQRREASAAFIRSVAAPLFGAALAPYDNPEALRLVLNALRWSTRKLPEKREERLAVLREALAAEVLLSSITWKIEEQGPAATAKHLAGVAKTLGIRLPKSWDEAAASYQAGVSTETEEDE